MDKDTEEIVRLSHEISALGAGHRNHIVLQATINVCATAIVNACDTRQEAETASEQLAKRLAEAVNAFWSTSHPN